MAGQVIKALVSLCLYPTGGTDKIWWKEKDEKLIIPQGLRERDFKVMPSRELKKPGPVFGTNAGKELFWFYLWSELQSSEQSSCSVQFFSDHIY